MVAGLAMREGIPSLASPLSLSLSLSRLLARQLLLHWFLHLHVTANAAAALASSLVRSSLAAHLLCSVFQVSSLLILSLASTSFTFITCCVLLLPSSFPCSLSLSASC